METISSPSRSRIGRVTCPGWQKRHILPHPRLISTTALSCTELEYGIGYEVGAVLTDSCAILLVTFVLYPVAHTPSIEESALIRAFLDIPFVFLRVSQISKTTSSPSPITKKSINSAIGNGLYVQGPPANIIGSLSSLYSFLYGI